MLLYNGFTKKKTVQLNINKCLSRNAIHINLNVFVFTKNIQVFNKMHQNRSDEMLTFIKHFIKNVNILKKTHIV